MWTRICSWINNARGLSIKNHEGILKYERGPTHLPSNYLAAVGMIEHHPTDDTMAVWGHCVPASSSPNHFWVLFYPTFQPIKPTKYWKLKPHGVRFEKRWFTSCFSPQDFATGASRQYLQYYSQNNHCRINPLEREKFMDLFLLAHAYTILPPSKGKSFHGGHVITGVNRIVCK